jgi:fucokinase
MGVHKTSKSLIHDVIRLEKLSNGDCGWQDQAGGVVPGAKFITSSISLPLCAHTERLQLSPQIVSAFAKRIVLIYTGRAHLMAEIAQIVIRRWQLRLPEVVNNCRELITNCNMARTALQHGNWSQLG